MSMWPEATQETARDLLGRYPDKRSAVMPLLYLAMAEEGHLTDAGMEEVAEWVGLTPAQVRSVASFYTMFDLKPRGKHKLALCTNLPCALQGANAAAAHLKRKLGIGFNETTQDGMFTLKEGECFGACGDAPVILLNDKKMCCAMTPEKLDELMKELK